MTEEFIIAGFGGQGVLFMGKVLAYTGLVDGKEVSWLPSYGPEMRGGTANCHVIISDEPVASPLIINPTTLFAMNLPSLEKFEKSVAAGGRIVIDSTLIDPAKVTRDDVFVTAVPAAKWAEELNAKKLANMILLGAYVSESGIVPFEILEEGLKKSVPKSKAELFELNKKAILKGFNK
jgi:2-oxoglutarate ferredoxin oxidoreductase subunit gamma